MPKKIAELTTCWNIPSLRKYVARCENRDEGELQKAAFEWLKASARNRIDYEIEWFGVPIIQSSRRVLNLLRVTDGSFGKRPGYRRRHRHQKA
jgi:hypothetical protein